MIRERFQPNFEADYLAIMAARDKILHQTRLTAGPLTLLLPENRASYGHGMEWGYLCASFAFVWFTRTSELGAILTERAKLKGVGAYPLESIEFALSSDFQKPD